MNFYIFKNKEMPWGDYGDTLLVGYAYPDEKDESKILIERTGPFVPPVYTWAKMILISDTFKQKLEKSDLKGFEYQETVFHKIVNLDWTKWDLDTEDPKIYPNGGEPENYILSRKHSPETAEKMEKIWCLKLNNKTLTGRKERNISSRQDLFIIENSWTGSDIFNSEGAGYAFFSEKAKLWFENNADDFANFEPFNSKVATQEEIDFAKDYIKPRPQKNDPFAHLTPKDWKTYQKFIEQANKLIAKSNTDKTEKSKLTSITKAIESLKNAEQIRPLGKKEQGLLNKLKDK
ncbi:hypothetical protein J0383_11655 [Flavobacterium endoglycinae]|uniref:Uncharacterized protein n=1 Tax=Flavobacterium endoglycinae TaxID=2816357 RepID=A0ABX7QJZ2_9FLAO|nr:hypothetical protein [Flavobacterium endoglycinae]QSW91431.1 hypothetical protein J0383_11655 [Flavobacterium endoglycinae]